MPKPRSEDFNDEKAFGEDTEEEVLSMMYPEGLDDNYIDDVLNEDWGPEETC